MKLLSVWLHLLGMAVWVGGFAYQSHVLLPGARRSGDTRAFAEAAARGRGIAWIAVCLVVITGLYSVTRLGPLDRVMETGAGVLLAGKFILVLAMIWLCAHRDFALVPRLLRGGGPPALRTVAWLDRAVLLLAAVVMYLGVTASRLAR